MEKLKKYDCRRSTFLNSIKNYKIKKNIFFYFKLIIKNKNYFFIKKNLFFFKNKFNFYFFLSNIKQTKKKKKLTQRFILNSFYSIDNKSFYNHARSFNKQN